MSSNLAAPTKEIRKIQAVTIANLWNLVDISATFLTTAYPERVPCLIPIALIWRKFEWLTRERAPVVARGGLN